MKNDLVSEVMTALEGVECECEPSEVTCYRCAALDSVRRAEKRIEDLERSVGALRAERDTARRACSAVMVWWDSLSPGAPVDRIDACEEAVEQARAAIRKERV